MSYNAASVDQFAPAYDVIIERALILVNRSQEYTAPPQSIDESRKRTYRLIFIDSLALLAMRAVVFWTHNNVILSQGINLEPGYAYLPNDFLTFYNPITRKTLLSDKITYCNGQGIVPMAGESIDYLRLPLSIDEFPIVFVEALKLLFLYNCGMLDSIFMALAPVLLERYRMALFNLDNEINKVIRIRRR